MEISANRISPADVILVVYENDNSRNRPLNVSIVRKTLRSFSLNVNFKEVKQNWEEYLNNSLKRIVFIVSSETYLSRIKKTISPLRERNNNKVPESDVKVLVIIECYDEDENDDDDDVEFDFDIVDEEEDTAVKVNTLDHVYKWWPFVLHFLGQKTSLSNEKINTREYSCFFLYNEESRKEADWFKNHGDALEKLGIRYLKRESNSKVKDDIYMKNSHCVVMYVNNRRNIKNIKEKVINAVGCGCKVRLYLENATVEFAERVRDECEMILSGTTIHAHWANLIKDLNIIDANRVADSMFYSRTGDRNFREILSHDLRPVTARQIQPVMSNVYSFERKPQETIVEERNFCHCNIV